MKKKDIDTFIEGMESIGDKWTPEQVVKTRFTSKKITALSSVATQRSICDKTNK